jgi:cobalamin biosynthesis Mg chelatase CobN
LHVFGYPPQDSAKLAEYVVTVMSYDTHAFPSIRRYIAEYLGLNYDQMKRKPRSVNALGLTNYETLQILHKVAVNVMKRLLELNVKSCMLTAGTLSSLLKEEVEKTLGDGVVAGVKP